MNYRYLISYNDTDFYIDVYNFKINANNDNDAKQFVINYLKSQFVDASEYKIKINSKLQIKGNKQTGIIKSYRQQLNDY